MSSMTATTLREFVIDRLMFEAENCEDAKVRLEALMHLQKIFATFFDAATLPISVLDLTVRAENCLKSENIETVEQLCQYSENDLLKVLGRRALNQIKEALLARDRHLRRIV